MLPPSIEKSGVAFEPDTTDDGKPAVRWGMGSIKGLGSYAAPLVRSTRGKGITKIEDLAKALAPFGNASRSEEYTSELQSLMRISYAVFCLKKKKLKETIQITNAYNASEQIISGSEMYNINTNHVA